MGPRTAYQGERVTDISRAAQTGVFTLHLPIRASLPFCFHLFAFPSSPWPRPKVSGFPCTNSLLARAAGGRGGLARRWRKGSRGTPTSSALQQSKWRRANRRIIAVRFLGTGTAAVSRMQLPKLIVVFGGGLFMMGPRGSVVEG